MNVVWFICTIIESLLSAYHQTDYFCQVSDYTFTSVYKEFNVIVSFFKVIRGLVLRLLNLHYSFGIEY